MTAEPSPGPPRPFRFTRDQYDEMDRLGYFVGKRVELIFGEVVETGTADEPRASFLLSVATTLSRVFGDRYWASPRHQFSVPNTVPASVLQPDVAVIPGSWRHSVDRPPTAAALLVEVPEATLAYDLTTKAEVYAVAGVPEYWVLDVENRQLHVLRDPAPLPAVLGTTAYRTRLTFEPSDRVSPFAAPSASILVIDLLPK